MSAYQTISELLVLALTCIACARVVTLQKYHLDPLSVLPPVTFIIALLMQAGLGVSPLGLCILLLTFIVFVWNLPAFLRFRAKKNITYIGRGYVLFSILHLVLSIVLFAIVIQTRPVKLNMRKFNVKKTAATYYGNFETGFRTTRQISQPKTAFWETYERRRTMTTDTQEARKIILFIPSECATINTYAPFLAKLARDGYTVYAAEFFCPELHWFYGVYDSKALRRYMFCYTRLSDDGRYRAAMNHKTFNLYKEFSAMLQEVAPREQDFVCLVGDDQVSTACKSVQEAHSQIVDAYFDLADVDGYTTPGYGPVEQTYPLLARLLGYKRDPSMYASIHLATVLERAIQPAVQKKLER